MVGDSFFSILILIMSLPILFFGLAFLIIPLTCSIVAGKIFISLTFLGISFERICIGVTLGFFCEFFPNFAYFR